MSDVVQPRESQGAGLPLRAPRGRALGLRPLRREGPCPVLLPVRGQVQGLLEGVEAWLAGGQVLHELQERGGRHAAPRDAAVRLVGVHGEGYCGDGVGAAG